MRIDLHCHSTRSDGTDAPAVVAGVAKTSQVSLLSLTDHDTTSGIAELSAYLEGSSVSVLRGVEISCHADDASVHVLAYDTGDNWDVLEAYFADAKLSRRDRLRKMGEKIAAAGLKIDVERIINEAGERTVGRPDLARAMIKAGYASSFKDAFTRYLHDGGPFDVQSHRLPLAEGLALGRAAGAKMSLAHPHLHGAAAESLLRANKDEGLTGIEAYYGSYGPSERQRFAELGAELGLVCTAGSDRHTAHDGNLGIILDDEAARPLLAWLGRG